MNFIMGFLLNCYIDKETTLKIFIQIFKNILNFAYEDNLKGVNLIFFSLD